MTNPLKLNAADTVPKLTIVLPTYNRAEKLKQSLANCTSNKRSDIEYIVIDNASPDATEDIVKSFQNTEDRLSYIRNPVNIGPNRTIFRAFLEARGRFIMILTDDDFVTDGFLDLVVELSEQYPDVGVIHHTGKSLQENGSEELHPLLPKTTLLKAGTEAVRTMFTAAGTITGITFNRSKINFDDWKLDDSIYPQVRLASLISLHNDALYFVSPESTIIPPNDSIAVRLKTRPSDYGIIERIDILEEVNRRFPEPSLYFPACLTLFSWARGVHNELFTVDKNIARIFFEKLSKNQNISCNALFWFELMKDRKILALYFLNMLCAVPKAIVSKKFWASLKFMLGKALNKLNGLGR